MADERPSRGMSLTTGALVLRSVSVFLARGRAAAAAREGAADQSGGARPPKMTQPNKLTPKQIEALRRKTHFTKQEIEGMYAVYRKLITSEDPANGTNGGGGVKSPAKAEGVEAETFRSLLHNTLSLVTEELVVERMFAVLDRAGEGALRFEAWLCGLSVLLRGTPPEKMAHCFSVYDLNSDGYITRDEMFLLLKNSLLKQPGDEDPDEGVRELVELVLRKLDVDKDGRVSFEDYRDTIAKEPLLLEAFGQCLPAGQDCDTFLQTLQA